MVKVALFFTWDVSLALWQEKGLLQREVRFYKELARRGVDVTFLTWGGAEERAVAQALPEIKIVPLYERLPRPRSKALRALVSLAAPWVAREELRGVDIIKTNQMWGGWCAALAKVMFGKTLMVRTGYELYQFTVKQGHSWARRAFVWFLSFLTYRTGDLVCVATAEDKNFVIKTFGVKPERIDVRPNWIDTEIFRPMVQTQNEGHILYVGRMNAQKNLEALIDAVANTNWRLDVVGEGELKDSLRARAQAAGAQVRFMGAVPNTDLPVIYNRYPVYILPSHYEGNPKTLLEAMACGRAVVGTAVPGIASVIEDGRDGVLCATDAAALRAGIARVMDDEALRAQMGAAARRKIERTQTIGALIDKEIESYQSLMNGKTT
jgi:glycosyltransferase involved in cell wall biosynthesis